MDNKKITIKQEKFCQEYINTSNLSEAYRRAYDTSKMKTDTIHRAAHELLQNPKVSTRVEELRGKVSIKHEVTRDKIIERLNKRSNLMDEIHTLAMKDTLTKEEEDKLKRLSYIIKTSDANKSDEMLAKILGINEPDKVEHSGGIIFNMIEPTKKDK
jgi:phage terminase small subunit